MKVTALVENTTNVGLPTEHGLSLYIETKRHRILFDTGKSGLFAENAARLGVDLKLVDICVLSHGHYDHGGGLKKFSTINENAPIYMNRNAFGMHFHGQEKYIGLNRDWLLDEELQQRIIYTDAGLDIDEELSIVVPKDKKVVDMGSTGLSVQVGGDFVPEDFRHEHYLLIRENGKRILISGCSHQGVINIVEWYRPDVLIGGFHFMDQEPGDILKSYGKMLDEYDTQYYTCHCTGVEQYDYLNSFMRRLHYLSEGEDFVSDIPQSGCCVSWSG